MMNHKVIRATTTALLQIYCSGIPYQIKQRAGVCITAENMVKSQHTDFNEDMTNESAGVACSNIRL